MEPGAHCAIAPGLLEALWVKSDAAACGLERAEFEHVLLGAGLAQNFGLTQGTAAEATVAQQEAFFNGLQLADLVLARACGAGKELAWARFIALYRAPLLRAAIAITGGDTAGRELADGLYADLYGLTVRDGERRCPLNSYSGRGSLMGWLRTTLAQRHVDHYRRTHREEPLNEADSGAGMSAQESAGTPGQAALELVADAVREALAAEGAEERFLLAAYFLDGRRLHQIAAVLGVHEATVSRKLKRTTDGVRKRVIRGLERRGLSRRQAEEALETDPRDLTDATGHTRWKELLQSSGAGAFKEQAER